ncbi:hypothetical protein ACHAXR_005293 [Thalassiosira sp. AJA248-18]
MIFGQLGGGVLGDWLGRHVAMALVMTLQVVSSFMSAWSGVFMEETNIYTTLACWRFLLGFGCGGVYPLAATITAESSASTTQNKGKSVALTFSMQGVGYLAVPVVAYLLVLVFGEDSDLTWRFILGLGSLPGILLIGSRIVQRRSRASLVPQKSVETDLDIEAESSADLKSYKEQPQIRLKPSSLADQIRNEPRLIQKLIGTAGCWLLFDILFYGNVLFQPVVLKSAFGESETAVNIIRDLFFVASIALPGYFVSVVMVDRLSPRRIQLQGFLCMAALYALIGWDFDSLRKLPMLVLYAATFFWSNFGPNTTTFMLPSLTFSRPCRSTLNGMCAASGKVGALIGSATFLPLASMLGNAGVMFLCAAVSTIAAFLTAFFTEGDAFAEEELLKGAQSNSEAQRISSEVHLSYLQKKTKHAQDVSRVISMPNFLDLE